MANTAGAVARGAMQSSPRPRTAPAWMKWTPPAAIACAVVYTAVRVWWAVNGPPSFGPLQRDLIVFTGWGAVALGVAAAGIAIALETAPWRRSLLVAAWTLSGVALAASAMLLLDLVGGLLPGIGVPFEPVAFASRAGAALTGALVAASAVAYRRRWRSDCQFCGRVGVRMRPTRIPAWASAAAYVAVAGCVIRLGAQVAVGFESSMLNVSPSLLLFEAGFILAGTLLPLALVCSWGRVFPRWVPLVAGRRVPRWVVLGPAFAIGGAMTGYFGFTLVTLAGAAFTGTVAGPTSSLPPAFFWVAVPAYFVWGVGLVAAGAAYYRVTRPICQVCGQ